MTINTNGYKDQIFKTVSISFCMEYRDSADL